MWCLAWKEDGEVGREERDQALKVAFFLSCCNIYTGKTLVCLCSSVYRRYLAVRLKPESIKHNYSWTTNGWMLSDRKRWIRVSGDKCMEELGEVGIEGWSCDVTRRIAVADDPCCNTSGVNGSQRCLWCLISPHAVPFKMNLFINVRVLESEHVVGPIKTHSMLSNLVITANSNYKTFIRYLTIQVFEVFFSPPDNMITNWKCYLWLES